MESQVKIQGKDIVIYLDGEIDNLTAMRERKRCDAMIESNVQAARIMFNIEKVDFADSALIAFLIGRYKKAHRLGIPVFIQRPSYNADKLLALSGIYTLIPKIK